MEWKILFVLLSIENPGCCQLNSFHAQSALNKPRSRNNAITAARHSSTSSALEPIGMKTKLAVFVCVRFVIQGGEGGKSLPEELWQEVRLSGSIAAPWRRCRQLGGYCRHAMK